MRSRRRRGRGVEHEEINRSDGRRRYDQVCTAGSMKRACGGVISRATAPPLILGLFLAGCVSLTPNQDQKLAEMQAFADRATAIYRVPSVRISVQSATNLNIGAVYRQGNIFLNVRTLDSANLRKTIAHELAH